MQSRKKFPWIRNKWRAAKNLAFIHGPGRRFKRFEASFHPETWARHDELLAWAESKAAAQAASEAVRLYEESDDPIIRQGYALRGQVTLQFRNRCSEFKSLRILIHAPPPDVSFAYTSLWENFAESFRFLGVTTHVMRWHDETSAVLENFQPTVLLTVDHQGHLAKVDWNAVREYRRTKTLRLGLNASLQEYGNTPLEDRLRWAQEHDVDFYLSFRDPQYVNERYHAILGRGYRIFNLEYGANPLMYYPVPGVERNLNYVFLASTNPDKWSRYYSYFKNVMRRYPGYIDGPWWSLISRFGTANTHRYLCASARIALNLHIPNQIEWACELNERTYNLAACGVPQLVDRPKLLSARFGPESFFVADTPEEYETLFAFILSHPEEAERRALQAQREVFAKHTVFHRAASFVEQLARAELFERVEKFLPESLAAV